MPQPTKSVIHSKRTLFDDFFKIDELRLSYERFDGAMSPEQRLLVFERGDAVAALLYDRDKREVILVNQFRAPTLGKGVGQGWIVETAAGMIRPTETPEQCLLRELQEETGYVATDVTKVATFFSSPGGSSERIFLYFAEVRHADAKAKGGGLDADGENIDLARYPIDTFFRKLDNREFEDPKIIIAGQWLRQREAKTLSETERDKSRTFRWGFKDSRGKIVGIKTGDIIATKDVDVWVNSENTDMMMDRFFGRSVSATIRYYGAKKVEGTDRIAEDTIGEALRERMNGRNFVEPGTVIDTVPGELGRKGANGVKRIFHVASVRGAIGQGLKTDMATIKLCVDEVLDAIEHANRRPKRITGFKPHQSVLFPMLGTGQGGFRVEEVAPVMVERAIAFFQANTTAKLNEIYFLAYSIGDREVLEHELRASSLLEPLP